MTSAKPFDGDLTDIMVREFEALYEAAYAGGLIEATMRVRALTELAQHLSTEQLAELAYHVQEGSGPFAA